MQSVLKSLQVLEAVARHQPARVGQLSTFLGMSKSTVQRCLRTLAEAGWIAESSAQTTHWVLSNHARYVLSSSQAETGLREVALPVMRRLRDQTGETVHLSIPGPNHTMVIIERAESQQQLRTTVPIGSAYPEVSTASGVALLAHANAERIQLSVADHRARKPEEFDEQRLREEIAQTRRVGYCVQPSPGGDTVAVGAAILERGSPAAGIVVLVPATRFRPAASESLGSAVVAAAVDIEKALKQD